MQLPAFAKTLLCVTTPLKFSENLTTLSKILDLPLLYKKTQSRSKEKVTCQHIHKLQKAFVKVYEKNSSKIKLFSKVIHQIFSLYW